MHGVGWQTMSRVLETAGFDTPTLVDEQIAPDAAFPTVAFPNPEEPGAMDLSFARARAVDAELIVANDPDADRLAIAIPDPPPKRATGASPATRSGSRSAGRPHAGPPMRPATPGPNGALACSIVSSPGPRGGRERLRPRLRGHAHGLQVDLARAGPRLRLRGGSRLPREPRRPCATKTASRRVSRSSRSRPS